MFPRVNTEDKNTEKVIFLDIDGVLNNVNTKELTPNGFTGISDELVKKLAKIVSATEAKIVLTSTWKKEWHVLDICCTSDGLYLKKKLKKENLEIVSRTIDEKVEDFFLEDRGKGIHRMLNDLGNVDTYVVLDDHVFSDFDEEIMKHLILTDSKLGLSEKDVSKAIKVLMDRELYKK